jgi:hypothetical protein
MTGDDKFVWELDDITLVPERLVSEDEWRDNVSAMIDTGHVETEREAEQLLTTLGFRRVFAMPLPKG